MSISVTIQKVTPKYLKIPLYYNGPSVTRVFKLYLILNL